MNFFYNKNLLVFYKRYKSILSILISLTIIFYLIKNIDLDILLKSFNVSLSSKNSLIVFFILILNPYLMIKKWFLIIKKDFKQKFLQLYEKITNGLVASEIFQNNLVLDFYKFYYLPKIGIKKKIFYIFCEKIFTIFFRLIFIFLLLLFFLAYKFLNLFIIIIFILIMLFVLNNFFFKLKISNFYLIKKLYLMISKSEVDTHKLIFIETLRNIILSCAYFFIFNMFFDKETSLLFCVAGPILEIFLRLQVFSAIGFRELIFFSISPILQLNEIAVVTASVTLTCVMLVVNISNFILFHVFKFFTKKL